MKDTEEIIRTVIRCASKVRRHLAAGFLESIYQKALTIELQACGLQAEMEYPIQVYYRDIVVGEFKVDILVERRIIVELKAVLNLHPIHEAQLVNYLTATHIDDGLLINFGGKKLEIKRKYRIYRPPQP